MAEPDIKDIKHRMKRAVETLHSEFAGLRTGRASASMLDPVMVEAYGTQMPINQVASINVPDARMLTVQVWDKSNVKNVEKAIRSSGLGLNPQPEGSLIRVPIPEMTEERRNELVKVAHRYAEQARVAVRNVRRDGMDQVKKLEKRGDMSQDDAKSWYDKIQKLTDDFIKDIDQTLERKEKDIKQV